MLKEVKVYFHHYDIPTNNRSRMTTAILISRQNDAGSRAHST